jgi:thiol:disulfide interchange protein DsbC
MAQTRPAAPGVTQGGVLTPETAPIKRAMEEKFPGSTIGSISKSPLPGLYEVQLEDQLVYTDAKVTYVVVGSMYDASTKQNLTEERRRKMTRIAWDSLPLELAMKKVKGNGQRKLVVFADADCPFCSRLENDLKGIDNVTIWTFMYPLDQLHPDAARKTRQIWCAPDRVAAWDTWFEQKKLPDNKGDCDTPIEKTAQLGMKLRVNATPTLIFADGSMIPGAVPPARIEQEFRNIDSEAANVAVAPQPAAAPAPAPAAAAAKAKK